MCRCGGMPAKPAAGCMPNALVCVISIASMLASCLAMRFVTTILPVFDLAVAGSPVESGDNGIALPRPNSMNLRQPNRRECVRAYSCMWLSSIMVSLVRLVQCMRVSQLLKRALMILPQVVVQFAFSLFLFQILVQVMQDVVQHQVVAVFVFHLCR